MSPARRARRLHRLRVARTVALALLAVTCVISLVPGRSEAAPVPGSAGTQTALPRTDSTVVVQGRGAFSSLEVTVNQTRNLTNQAVSVTWTGGKPTLQSGGSIYGSNFLQIYQCWGDDDGTNPDNPGPAPERCEAGAAGAVYGGASDTTVYPYAFGASRLLARADWARYDPSVGVTDPETGNSFLPFEAVDGTSVPIPVDNRFNPQLVGGSYWLNPYFNSVTTNEVAGAATGPDGTGQKLFQAATGLEAPGLGCGQKVEPVAGAAPRVPRCWLVVVPRGDIATENAGTTLDPNAVGTSPLSTEAWRNRIAVPLEFTPVDSPCSIDAASRRLAGSELLVGAITSWQPALCATPGAPPFVYGTISDSSARLQITQPTVGSPGMAITPSPIDPALDDPDSPTVYAPLSLSGLSVGFVIERNPPPSAPAEEQALNTVRIEDLNLTPRLVAKLLTQSYSSQVDILALPSGYSWAAANPGDLSTDPDFLQFNPEFELLQTSSRNMGGLVVAVQNSDSARQVWQWILADPEARAWLDGAPDRWGMRVNPVYATTASANTNGVAFGDPAPDSFPKSDPRCVQAASVGAGLEPPLVCGPDWKPYTGSFRDSARAVASGTDGAKVLENVLALSVDQIWKREEPQQPGKTRMLGLTDTPFARLYGLQTAKLSRAGDDGSARDFVGPDDQSLLKGLEAMRPSAVPEVLEPDPTADVPGAYPLTSLTYGAIRPLDLDAGARADYADFVAYAAGPGQTSGLEPGELPPGYVPLPASLQQQAARAAETIRTLQPRPEPVPAPDAPAAPVTSTGAPPNPSGSASPSSPASVRGPSATARPSLAPAVAEPIATTVVEPAAAATPQAGPLTPVLAIARSRFFLPVLAAIGLISVLGALEVTKRPRRAMGVVSREDP